MRPKVKKILIERRGVLLKDKEFFYGFIGFGSDSFHLHDIFFFVKPVSIPIGDHPFGKLWAYMGKPGKIFRGPLGERDFLRSFKGMFVFLYFR